MTKTGLVRRRRIGHCDLPFDLAQGGESFDFAQDRESVERLVEPFLICDLEFLFLELFQFSHKIFQAWPFVDIVHVYVADNSLLINDEKSPFAHPFRA